MQVERGQLIDHSLRGKQDRRRRGAQPGQDPVGALLGHQHRTDGPTGPEQPLDDPLALGDENPSLAFIDAAELGPPQVEIIGQAFVVGILDRDELHGGHGVHSATASRSPAYPPGRRR